MGTLKTYQFNENGVCVNPDEEFLVNSKLVSCKLKWMQVDDKYYYAYDAVIYFGSHLGVYCPLTLTYSVGYSEKAEARKKAIEYLIYYFREYTEMTQHIEKSTQPAQLSLF